MNNVYCDIHRSAGLRMTCFDSPTKMATALIAFIVCLTVASTMLQVSGDVAAVPSCFICTFDDKACQDNFQRIEDLLTWCDEGTNACYKVIATRPGEF